LNSGDDMMAERTLNTWLNVGDYAMATPEQRVERGLQRLDTGMCGTDDAMWDRTVGDGMGDRPLGTELRGGGAIPGPRIERE